jgi:hypothetical protein
MQIAVDGGDADILQLEQRSPGWLLEKKSYRLNSVDVCQQCPKGTHVFELPSIHGQQC